MNVNITLDITQYVLPSIQQRHYLQLNKALKPFTVLLCQEGTYYEPRHRVQGSQG